MRLPRMSCRKCPRYEVEKQRCSDGKANPRRKADAFSLVELLGIRSLCHYSPYRDRIVLQTHFPHHPSAITPLKRSYAPGKVEIEIEPEPLAEADADW